ncbi:hypothetical protein F2Q69_00063522 [Brassica cretica]|uniref:Uncharacterized protein n=1 Tax=Brassica cretica TaxID=69181 RepID=A0A8S9RDM1_BRACR|nr:hypothetical protein F2Q69_00063522 [Brassica cretica]
MNRNQLLNQRLKLAPKRNERKKEKRLQAAAEQGNSSEDGSSNVDKEEAVPILNVLVSGLESLDVSSDNDVGLGEVLNPGTAGEDTEKRIRALKKKVRFSNLALKRVRP